MKAGLLCVYICVFFNLVILSTKTQEKALQAENAVLSEKVILILKDYCIIYIIYFCNDGPWLYKIYLRQYGDKETNIAQCADGDKGNVENNDTENSENSDVETELFIGILPDKRIKRTFVLGNTTWLLKDKFNLVTGFGFTVSSVC